MTENDTRRQDDRITRIETKLDHLTELILSRPVCPDPGSCIDLGRRMENAELVLISDGKRLGCIETRQAVSMAIVSIAAFLVMPLLVLLGPLVRLKFGLP